MTSHDVRDMLDLPNEASRPAKKMKVSAPRQVLKGLAREVQNLSGDNPISIVPEVSVFKKKKPANRKPVAKWESRPFTNSARGGDGLVLRHWRRKDDVQATTQPEDPNAAPILEDSTFGKYNVKVQVPSFEPDVYRQHLENPDWTMEESKYLMDTVKEYDLRWPVVWDRYEYMPEIEGEANGTAMVTVPKVRTLEDLKSRYYWIAAQMMAINTPLERMMEAEFQLHELMLQYNGQQEAARKSYCEKILGRTKEEAREEESLLLELKRILARTEKVNEERKELYSRLEAPPSTGNISLYTSSSGLQQLLQQLMTVDKSKKRKSIMGGPEAASPATGGPAAISQQPSFDRRDSSLRESVSGPSGTPTTTNNKKGPPPNTNERRVLSKEEEEIYGVTHPERTGPNGPSFRQERLNRAITTKSATQQSKIVNVLNELEIPSRLVMPTAEVGEQWEGLLASIQTLLEARKVAEKLSGEIQIAKNLKSEREAKEKAARGVVEMDGVVEGGDGETAAPAATFREPSVPRSVRGASGAPNKRSASVLSTASDKSNKRQKKAGS